MANPTTNFGWVLPTSTDLVTDLPADFEIALQGVDTAFVDLKGGTTGQILSKASNTDLDFTWANDAGIPATLLDAKGDLIVASAADTAARVAVGTNGQVLTADSGATNGVTWTTPAGAQQSFTLLNAGGTSLTGSSVTVSGISDQEELLILLVGVSGNNVPDELRMQFNGDTGNNYRAAGAKHRIPSSTWDKTLFTGYDSGTIGHIWLGSGRGAGAIGNASVRVNGCKSTGTKAFKVDGGYDYSSNDYQELAHTQGYYAASAAITSVTVFQQSAAFDAGTIFVYGSAN